MEVETLIKQTVQKKACTRLEAIVMLNLGERSEAAARVIKKRKLKLR